MWWGLGAAATLWLTPNQHLLSAVWC
jgi:hypothetical protein